MGSKRFVWRAEWKIALCLLAAAPFLLTCWVHGDGIGYVAMLRSAVVDHDLDLADEFAHLGAGMQSDAWGLPASLLRHGAPAPGLDSTYHMPKPDAVTGRVPAHYSVGPPLAWAPGYAVAHVLTRAWHRIDPSRQADGYGGLYYLAIALGSLAFGIAGMVLAFRLARSVLPEAESFWAALAMVWASPLVYYLYLSPEYSHALTTLSSGAFFLYWWRTRGADAPLTWFRWGALAGLLFLVRWNDVAMALPVFAVEVTGLVRRRGISALALPLLAAAAGALLVASPQLAAWQFFHGRPWVRYPEAYVGAPVHGLLGTLFSTRHGLFVWTPVTVLSVLGLLSLLRRERVLAGVALASLALLVLGNCTARDWWGGASFGMRRLVSGTPLFALGLAAWLDDARGWLAARSGGALAPVLAPAVFAAFALWNLALLGQYALGMISHTEAVPIATLVANQPRVFARALQLLSGAGR